MGKSLKEWFWTMVYNFKYRNIDEDLCCCGSQLCHGDYNHSFVSAKEYHIHQLVKRKTDGNA